MSEETPKQAPKKNRLKRWLWGIFGFSGLLLLLVQGILFFFATPIFQDFVKEKTFKNTKGLYQVDFSDISLIIGTRSVQFDDLKITPDTSVFNILKKDNPEMDVIYKVEIPKLKISWINIYQLITKKHFSAGVLFIKNPQIEMIGEFRKEKDSSNQLLEHLSNFFSSVMINKIKMEEGSLNLFNLNANKQKDFNASNINIELRNFSFDSLNQVKDKLFYSDGFKIDIYDYEIKLRDSIHILRAKSIELNSDDSSMYAKNIDLIHRESPEITRKATSKIFYNIKVPTLRIEGANIKKAFFEKQLSIKEMRLLNPDVKIYDPIPSSNIAINYDLYELIEGQLSDLNIKKLNVQGGSIETLNFRNEKFNTSVTSAPIEISLISLQIDSTSLSNKKKAFYSDSLNVQFNNCQISIANGTHELQAERININSQKEEATAKNIKIIPLLPDSTIIEKYASLYNIIIPTFKLIDINIIKVINNKMLDAYSLDIKSPTLDIKRFVFFDRHEKPNNKTPFIYTIAHDYLKSIRITEVNITSCDLNLARFEDKERNAFANSLIDLSLYNFQLDSSTITQTFKIFYADNIVAKFRNYSLKLSDDIHFLKGELLSLSTVKSEIYAKDIRIIPVQGKSIYAQLNKNESSQLYDINIPHIKLFDADIYRAYFHKKFNIRYVSLANISFRHTTFVDLEHKQKGKVNINEFYNLLGNYLGEISIQKIALRDGLVKFNSYKDGISNTSIENNIKLSLENFHFDSIAAHNHNKILFSDKINLSIYDYRQQLADSIHQLLIDSINLSSTKKEMKIYGLELNPTMEKRHRRKYTVDIPQISLIDIDINKVFFKKDLTLSRLIITDPFFEITKEYDTEKSDNRLLSDLPIDLNKINIKKFKIQQGTITLSTCLKNRLCSTYSSGTINTTINNLALRSPVFDVRKNKLSNKDINIQLENFFFDLPDSTHQLSAKHLNLDINNGTAIIQDLRIQQQYNSTNKNHIDLESPITIISGVNLDNIINNNNITLDKISLEHPNITINNFKKETKKKGNNKELLNNFNFLKVNKISFNNAEFKTLNHAKNKQFGLQKIEGHFKNFLLDNSSLEDPPLFFSKSFDILTHDYEMALPDSLFILKASHVQLSSNKNELTFVGMEIKPTISRLEYSKHKGYEADWIHFKNAYTTISGINIKELIKSNAIEARSMTSGNASIYIYRDKRYPAPNHKPPMMQDMIKQFKTPIRLDTLTIWGSQIKYEEIRKTSPQPGHLTFDQFTLKVHNITNNKEQIRKNVMLDITASAKLMNKADLRLSFHFPMNSSNNTFYFNGFLDSIQLNEINPILENVAFISVKSGKCESLKFNAEGNNDFAKGEMTFRYDNLKISLIDKEQIDRENSDRGLASFFANTFLIKSKNPTRVFPRIGEMYYERNENKFIINLCWRTLLSGLKTTLGFKDKEE